MPSLRTLPMTPLTYSSPILLFFLSNRMFVVTSCAQPLSLWHWRPDSHRSILPLSLSFPTIGGKKKLMQNLFDYVWLCWSSLLLSAPHSSLQISVSHSKSNILSFFLDDANRKLEENVAEQSRVIWCFISTAFSFLFGLAEIRQASFQNLF